jgi:hypothetical protein
VHSSDPNTPHTGASNAGLALPGAT